jgi:carbamoyltransferase
MSGRSGGQVVLGLCAFTHDSSAALIHVGRLVGFVEEERLSGVKHTKEYPELAVAWLLGEAGLTPGDVDVVAYNFAGHRHLAAIPASAPFLVRPETRGRTLARARSFARVHRNFRRRMDFLRDRFPSARIRPVPHHRAHGVYAFAASGLPDAGLLVVDSLGETQTTSIAHARRSPDGGIDIYGKDALHDPASLGYAYGAVTEHLGWRRGDEEGTVMALAALGDPARFRQVFAEAIRLTDLGFTLDPRWFPLRVLDRRWPRTTPAFAAATCPPRRPEAAVARVHADLAAALQERTEQAMVHLALRAHRLTGSRRLVLGGGVAMNCVAVGKIIASGIYETVFVPPAPGDSGTAIGAAIAAHLELAPAVPCGVEQSCYLGPDIGPGSPAVDLAGLCVRRLADPVRHVAAQLAEGAIVGICRGRLEAGPRALGNRSILASPLTRDVVDRLNSTIKFREPFRPFAPVVPADRAEAWFCLGQPSPYMSVAAEVSPRARQQIPAVVHANGTARVQTVTRTQNRFLADLLVAFAGHTGIPVLLNTSLNVKGEPICGTAAAAIDCLRRTGLDALLLGDRWVTRP